VFWVISVYFNIRNTLPKSGTFLLGHPVHISMKIKYGPIQFYVKLDCYKRKIPQSKTQVSDRVAG